jgi:hypothetical protein
VGAGELAAGDAPEEVTVVGAEVAVRSGETVGEATLQPPTSNVSVATTLIRPRWLDTLFSLGSLKYVVEARFVLT